MQQIDRNLIRKNYSKNWLTQLKKNYTAMYLRNTPSNKNYFPEPGNYIGRNNKYGESEISDYLNRLLFLSNICVLDHLIKNKMKYKDMKFLDYGSGLGLLSVFLKNIGLECDNYDNFSQIGSKFNVNDDFYDKYNIKSPNNNPLIGEHDVLICCGIWVDNEVILKKKYKYLILDAWYNGNIKDGGQISYKGNFKYDLTNYRLINKYDENLLVYKWID